MPPQGIRPGTVFRLDPPLDSSSAWRETTLYRFTGFNGDGASPVAGVVVGSSGELYGTTQWGGSAGNGSAYELLPPKTPAGQWTEKVLYRFTSQMGDGEEPADGMVRDENGSLYGTTLKGGSWGNGTIFELRPPSRPGASWSEKVLYNFTGRNGDGAVPRPEPSLVLDHGMLYGTTLSGGAFDAGTVFRIKTSHSGSPASLH